MTYIRNACREIRVVHTRHGDEQMIAEGITIHNNYDTAPIRWFAVTDGEARLPAETAMFE